MNELELGGDWSFPTSITAGAGAITQLPDCCEQLGITRPLLVTDPGLAALPLVADALSHCRAAGVEAGLFSNIKGNPTGQNISDGLAAYTGGGHDGVIAFGGGSAIDATKVIALMAAQTRSLWELEDPEASWTLIEDAAVAPIVAVPTTAGTGSEVGRAALITDEQRHVKKIIVHARLLPSRVILDPQLTLGLPPSLTAATGMDALSHNLEAFCSPAYHPLAEGVAVEGIRLVKEYLPLAVAEGSNMTARMHMLVASSMGATAFQKGLGAMHALAHPLGALFDAHHGLLNAVLMPYVLKANQREISGRIERVARYIDLADASFDGFLNWVLELRALLGIPHTLSSIGIDERQKQRVGEMAIEDPTAATNPVAFTATQYSELFARAVNGDL